MTGKAMVTGMVTANDGMANVVAGLGAANAKTQVAYLVHSDPVQLENSYRASTWFGKIVDVPATDSVRNWRQWQAKPEEITALENTEKRLQVKQKVRDALILQRLLGGAVIIPTGLPGAPDQELDINLIRKDTIKSLTLLNRYQIQTQGRITDINSKWFDQPEWYVFNGTDGAPVRLHPSRVVRFSARRFTHANTGDDGWGDSIWLRLADSIQNSETATAALTALLVEAKLDIIRMPDLTNNMATEKAEQALMRRMTIATQLKSVANTLLLDKDDEFEQKQLSFGSLSDTGMFLLQVMCGAADIPMTRLLNTQAKGLSNGGDIDLKNYYDRVSSGQELDIDPALQDFNHMLIACALGKDDNDIWYEWRPLYQMSEKEESEVEKNYADVADKLVNTGLIAPDVLAAAVTDRMVNSGSWPALESALAVSKQQAEEVLRGENSFEPTAAEKLAAERLAGGPAANEDDPQPEQRRRAANDAAPRTLYASRPLLNGAELLAWAQAQGFTGLLSADKLHVTLAYSKNTLDWMKVGDDWNSKEDGTLRVPPGGVRLVESLGEEGDAVTLMFTSSPLSWRHEQIKSAGASWDWEDYQPHITFSWKGAGAMDLRTVEPYRGELLFGPEVFAEIDPEWQKKVKG
jgi:phage-related protein (TIGR01555 family)